MKLARIDHIRCGDYDSTTVVWIPDDMTERKFENAILRAQGKYLAFLEEFLKEDVRPNHSSYNFAWNVDKKPKEYTDDMTLGEAKAKFKLQAEEYKAWSERRSKANSGFMKFLEEEGMVSFWIGLDSEKAFSSDAEWGHLHGTPIVYDETEVGTTYKEPEE